ncbi:HSP20 family protein [Roseomonas rosea]|uniref:HSP20 family protein n=1 Tax=Muricoccus roseus TaxID=198092 RepID=A0A1M6SP71_9PROT|nr:Hsp20/alpha crystallin family protein [Roseomonas rosea]SHK46544.1 HSP20 family protein [Roseomonas rosea]
MAPRFFGAGLVPHGSDPFSLLQREVNRAFDEVFRGFPAATRGAAAMGGFAPSLDVRETEGGLEVAAELPGMTEGDIELRLEGDLLTLAGEKKEEQTKESGGLHLTERSFGRFQRAFRLPYRPDPAQVQARFDKGILHITLPRPQQVQSGGRIQIQAASDSGASSPTEGTSASGKAEGQAGDAQPQAPVAPNDPRNQGGSGKDA